jgi:hypothetical protein
MNIGADGQIPLSCLGLLPHKTDGFAKLSAMVGKVDLFSIFICPFLVDN